MLAKCFEKQNVFICQSCIRFHRFNAFRAGFLKIEFSYQLNMPIINIIECKKESCTEAFFFAPSMYSESSTAGNMGIYEDLVIYQIEFDKCKMINLVRYKRRTRLNKDAQRERKNIM